MGIVAGVALVAWLHGPYAQSAAGPALCVSHDYLGQRPNTSHDEEGDLPWSLQAQGLAHDSDNWYVTNNDTAFVFDPTTGGFKFVVNPILRRIPVTTDLADGDTHCSDPGISCNQLVYDTPLFDHGYNHYGDPDFSDFQGTGYVVVPIENGVPGAGVAVFRGDASLQFLSFAAYKDAHQPVGVTPQDHSSWVTLDPDGLLLSSNSGDSSGVGEVHRYRVQWAHLKDTCERRMCELLLDWIDTIALKDEAGNALQLRKITGGEFSDDGLLLYVLSGQEDANGGINVFQTRPGSAAECGPASCLVAQRVEHSTNESGLGGFKYEFHRGTPDEEPEGLTFWDLDADGRAPCCAGCSSPSPPCTEGKLGGQLHVMLLHLGLFTDEVDVKHYRRFFDVSPPAITCPSDTQVLCGAATDPSATGEATATDDCDPSPDIGHSDNVVPTNDPANPIQEVIERTWTATDNRGNHSSCVQDITVLKRVLSLDIKPGSCPNPLDTRARGAIPMSLLGTASFDVRTVDVASLLLSREDGIGGAIAPTSSALQDTGTPFSGALCGCSTLGEDRIVDLSLKFDNQSVVSALQLSSVAPNASVQLVLSGTLSDGCKFIARDCMVRTPIKGR